MINWTEVTSSNIACVALINDTLCVRFTSGALYTYDDVDEQTFQTLCNVPSVGHYFNLMIKTFHHYNHWLSEQDLENYVSRRSAKSG